jgi:hypothetical protein
MEKRRWTSINQETKGIQNKKLKPQYTQYADFYKAHHGTELFSLLVMGPEIA